MNHCFLLMTHFSAKSAYDQVLELMNEKHFFVIHFDRKTNIPPNDPFLLQLQSLPCVRLVRDRLNVQWGSYATVEATLRLIREAFHFSNISYFHLISGQCRHVKSIGYIHAYFSTHAGEEFIQSVDMDTIPDFLSRFAIFHWHDYYNLRSTRLKDVTLRRLSKISRVVQKTMALVGLRRRTPEWFPNRYVGSAWWSLTAECCRYMLAFIKENPAFVQRFKYTQLADEMFFQTLIMQSRVRERVARRNLRFISFKTRHAEELTMAHALEVSGRDILFARKITRGSEALMAFVREPAVEVVG